MVILCGVFVNPTYLPASINQKNILLNSEGLRPLGFLVCSRLACTILVKTQWDIQMMTSKIIFPSCSIQRGLWASLFFVKSKMMR